MDQLLIPGIVTFALQFSGFVVAALLQTEVFYDVLGGLNFLLLGFIGMSVSSTRLIWLTTLFTLSRGWLLVFLAWRAHSRKGDARFDGVKDSPATFFVYWMVQACWVYIISLPILVEQAANNKNGLTPVDWILLGGFLVSILLEIISDVQKTVWVENGRQGNFCRVRLWKYSRHPNYAGEIFQWWFAAAFAARSGYKHGWIVFLSPLFTMNILLNLSGTGILNAEGKNLKRYYEAGNAQEYKAYREATSPLIPMIGYKSIPMSLKRALLFEFKSYEYNPPKDE